MPKATGRSPDKPKQARGSIRGADRGAGKASGSRKVKPTSKSKALQESPQQSSRSSKYRGVTKHRRSGRWEAHIWVKEIARQVYLGGYEHEDHAAEAYDVAAIKCKGPQVKTNFDKERYRELMGYIDQITLEELVMSVRRQSQGFARGSSKYRGVTHHPSGRWEARIGVPGSKHIYLGLFDEEDEAGAAYDRALVLLRGASAATNFSLTDYREQLSEYHQLQQEILADVAAGEAGTGEAVAALATTVAIRKGLDVKYGSSSKGAAGSPQGSKHSLRSGARGSGTPGSATRREEAVKTEYAEKRGRGPGRSTQHGCSPNMTDEAHEP